MLGALLVAEAACLSPPCLGREPHFCCVRKQRHPLAFWYAVVGPLQFAAAGAFGVSRQCLARASRGFLYFLALKNEGIPPDLSTTVKAHLDSPFFGGLPPSLAHLLSVVLPYFLARALPPL